MMIEKSCGTVIFTREENEVKYVLVKNEGTFEFPNGFMENGESEVETALRELEGKKDLNASFIEGFKEKNSYLSPSMGCIIKQVIYFLGELSKSSVQKAKDLKNEYIVVNYADAMNILQFESLRKVLTKANNFLESIF